MWINIDDDTEKSLKSLVNCNDLPAADDARVRQFVQDMDRRIAEDADPDNAKYRATAEEIHGHDGECEIDDGAVVSVSSDPGAYVMAWVWVYAKDAGLRHDCDEEDDVEETADEEEEVDA